MTKEEYNYRMGRLRMECNRAEVIRLCREYEKSCREEGDLDGLAEVLNQLSFELPDDEAKEVFDDLYELRKALAQNDFKTYGEVYALLLHRKSCTWSRDVDDAISCQEEAIDIYKRLGLYEERGFDIDYEDAFGYLGKLYCFKGNYELGIRYTTTALERAMQTNDNDFLIGLYYRRLSVAHLSLNDTATARDCIREALEYFTRAEQADPDPDTFPEVKNSCRQLLEECNERKYTDEFYQQWMIG